MMVRAFLSQRPAIALILGLFTAPLAAQHTSPEGFRLSWDNTISVVEDTLRIGNEKLPAWSITVYETTAKGALDLWRIDVRPQAGRISGSRPMLATNVKLNDDLGGPVEIRALSNYNRRSNEATLTLAFKGLGHDDRLRQYMHDLSVRLNQNLIQEQIAAIQKHKSDADRGLKREQKNHAKLNKRLNREKRSMENTMRRKARTQKKIAQQQRDLARHERSIVGTPTPRQANRLRRARRSLTGSNRQLSRFMRNEARSQRQINRITRDLQDSVVAQQAIVSGKDLKSHTLEALGRKQASIE